MARKKIILPRNINFKKISSLFCVTGIDGCGKGTQIFLLKDRLEKDGHDVAVVKAYGDAEKESLSHFMRVWDDMTITLIFQGLQHQQYANTLRERHQKKIVLADRWDESFYAYHSVFGPLSKCPELRDTLNQIAFNNCIPKLTFLLDVPIAEAEKRLISRGMDYFDKKGFKYHSVMRQQYLNIAKERKWVIIDGTLKPDQIHEIIYSEVRKSI
ncbi:thymidylate kinase [Candidatus Shapirobacteria bacterium]|nr:thymidylate kinase [Candidatus Shapirobacteria bacterium]